ncbi:hypothetical protein JXM67_00025 [candidate division WOR-3 bacterium]|nr:hypothetical protein [candidate division WOR-3 bacterium]
MKPVLRSGPGKMVRGVGESPLVVLDSIIGYGSRFFLVYVRTGGIQGQINNHKEKRRR